MTFRSTAGRWAILVAISAALTWLFARAAMPAAPLLGPMIAGIGTAAAGARVRVPRFVFIAAQALIGCLIARAITAPIIASIAHAWALMIAVVTATVAAGGLVGFLLARYGSLPGTTAAWGSSPGGASAMIAMSAEYGADPRLVAFMQYLRVIVVVGTASLVSRLLMGGLTPAVPASPLVPAATAPLGGALTATLALAAGGAAIARRWTIPAGHLLVPMTIGAVLHAAGLIAIELPPWLLAAAYAGLGWYVGVQFTRESIRHALRAVPQLLAATFALIGLCALSAAVLRFALGTDALTAYLATSPGGLDSVTIIAAGSGANIPFVLALQALRIFVVIFTGPALAKLIARYA